MKTVPPRSDGSTVVLFYYCDEHAFDAILQSGMLRMVHVSAMDDVATQNWLIELALEHISKLLSRREPNAFDPPGTRISADFCAALERELSGGPNIDAYCVCFSSDGDSPSQWRAYADDGRGFAIGFDPNALVFPDDMEVRDVNYDEVLHRTLVSGLMEEYRNRLPASPSPETLRQLASGFHRQLLTQSLWCKDPSSRAEKEWRIIQIPVESRTTGENQAAQPAADPPLGVRSEGSIHDRVFPFRQKQEQEPIVRVVLGPANSARSNPEALRGFLRRHGYAHVKIELGSAIDG